MKSATVFLYSVMFSLGFLSNVTYGQPRNTTVSKSWKNLSREERIEKIRAGDLSFDLVSTDKTAIQITEAVLTEIVGPEKVADARPFTATLEGEYWAVRGTLHNEQSIAELKAACGSAKCDIGYGGGTFELFIAKSDGQISRVTRGR